MQKIPETSLLFLCIFIMLFIGTVNLAHSTTTQTAVVACSAADWSSGAHSVVSVDPVSGPRNYLNNLLPSDTSDLTVVAYGNFFFRIERFNADNVTKFNINDPATPIWQYSTMNSDEVTSSNPYDLIFAGDEKAYLLRYDTSQAWIINPQATSEAQFKIGEIDLSSYSDQDSCPEMTSGTIVNDKLFILLQRINRDNNWAPEQAYVAVFDINTDLEIDTNIPNPDNVFGIPLPIKNPSAIQYLEENNKIYVQGAGRLENSWENIEAEYSGGIVSINPTTYETSVILDDGTQGTQDDHPYGNISGMAICSSTKGYFIGYKGWGDNTLYSFNPSTGEVGGIANDHLKNKNIAGMEAGAYADKNGMLWVCNATDAEVVIIDTVDNTIDEKIFTNLNPQKVAFVTGALGPDTFLNNSDNDENFCFISALFRPRK